MTSGRPAGPSDSPGFLLWRTTLRWQREVAVALRPLGLTHVQFVLLATVWWLAGRGSSGGSPNQHEVAQHASVDPMMTSQVLRVLAGRGLVNRVSDPADGRVRRLAVTIAGRALAERAIALVEEADAAFFGSADETNQAVGVLRRLAR